MLNEVNFYQSELNYLPSAFQGSLTFGYIFMNSSAKTTKLYNDLHFTFYSAAKNK